MKSLFAGVGIVGLVILGFVYSRDPSEGYGLPPCSFKAVTGYHCPGCGGTRAVHALLHGRLDDAVYYNPLFIFTLVAVIGGGVWLKLRRRQEESAIRMSTRQGVALAIVIIVTIFGFGLIRNFPWYPWLKAPIYEKPDVRKNG